MGIRDKPIAPRSPWQNGFAERLIGSIRRECVDHIVVLGEAGSYKINYDPLVMADGIQPTDDPVLLFRSPSYVISYTRRLRGL